jgi:hypothetical protein
MKGVMGMWVGTYDQFAFCSLKGFWTSLYCFYTSKTFCKVLNVASNLTKITQIDEGMSKKCLLQMKGVMGMWVHTYNQFAFWSLKSLDIILLSLHFKNLLYKFRWHFPSFSNCSKQTRNEEIWNLKVRGSNCFFPLWTSSSSFCFFVFRVLVNIVNFHLVHPWSWNVFHKHKKLQNMVRVWW